MSDSGEELSLLPKLKFKKKKTKRATQNGLSNGLTKKKKIVMLDFQDDEDEDKVVPKKHHSDENYPTSNKHTLDEVNSYSKQNSIPKKPKLQQLAERERQRQERHATANDNTDAIDEVSDAEDNLEQDRDWYAGDDLGHTFGDESHNPFGLGLENQIYDEEKEVRMKMNAVKRMSSEKKSRSEANDLWENNRMLNSGAMKRKLIDLDFNSDLRDSYSEILVHYNTPDFLANEEIQLNAKKGPVSPFRDPESDMAVFSRKGSALVKERMQSKEKKKQARDATSISGTALSHIIGSNDSDGGANESDDEGDIENNNKFINSLKNMEDEDLKDSESSDFAKNLTLKEQRRFLPAFTVRDKLLSVIDENQLIVVIGETGSGKTTQLTQYLYEHGYGKWGMIGCTQPRRVAAMSVAKRVSEEMECELGTKVGFSIRFEDFTSDETVIRYMTDGILLKETLTDPTLSKYSCIIIDEAHERTLNTDILLGLFKDILSRRMDLKIIITSATMNADKFSAFYGNAPQFTIPGRTFPVDIFYSRSTPEDYIESCVKTCLTIHLTRGPGDILVFLTGKMDIDTCCEVLDEKFKELVGKENDKDGVGEIPAYQILPIYSQMPADLQTKVFNRAKKGVRKVVVATNIAETSLTIDNIKYVVDAGYYKIKIFNSKMGMDTLQVAPISLANANQRSGRAGRTAPGVAYRLYTESAAKHELYKETIPEIQRTNLANTLLMLKSLQVNDIKKFPFLDAPPDVTIIGSLYELWSMGALNNQGELTELGRKMVKFPMEPSLSKLLINSIELGCSEEMITIVSMLSVPNVFYRPKERQDESDAIREKFFVPESDHLTLLNVYSQWKANNYSSHWCTKHFLHSKSLRRAKDIRSQLTIIMNQQKLEIRSVGTDWDNIRKCICSGYFHQAAKAKAFGRYTNLKTGLELNLHPTSSLFGLGDLPKYVIYHELILTTKEYMSYVTEVDAQWLAEYGNAFYTLHTKEFEQVGANTIWDAK
ncbi:DEAH-box RNA helicase [Saccharomycopsis crataegensis]|uniref:Pre-mRNA-splicing factor ATP-dependent RNA helicase PRP16 n=1 Tax=Saccharomycopsis crataegensis TaxID=43959 RepID=A0AAV5QEG1_9ASCO|nr:DEAH-box RNA helicase [Saccharomycopsis crataegensis]